MSEKKCTRISNKKDTREKKEIPVAGSRTTPTKIGSHGVSLSGIKSWRNHHAKKASEQEDAGAQATHKETKNQKEKLQTREYAGPIDREGRIRQKNVPGQYAEEERKPCGEGKDQPVAGGEVQRDRRPQT